MHLAVKIFLCLTSLSSPLLPINDSSQKVVVAVKLKEPVEIDGLLQEPAWQRTGYDRFIQSDPEDGAAPTENSYVWVAYDDDAIYVAARLMDSEPEKIIERLGRRDDFVDSDWFILSLDPYFDRRSGYKFAVNPAGSICDWALHNDVWEDLTWDAVWDWAARITTHGWNVEIKIPFHQLRFPKKESYVWGMKPHPGLKPGVSAQKDDWPPLRSGCHSSPGLKAWGFLAVI